MMLGRYEYCFGASRRRVVVVVVVVVGIVVGIVAVAVAVPVRVALLVAVAGIVAVADVVVSLLGQRMQKTCCLLCSVWLLVF